MKKFIDESWLVLLMGIGFACLLAGAQTGLNDRIQDNKKAALNQGIAEVVPDLGSEAPTMFEIDGNNVYKCLDNNGQLAGWAIVGSTGGFVDTIELVAGLSPDGNTITGIKVLVQNETPGLGDKITTDPAEKNFYPRQYTGRSTNGPFSLTKQDPQNPNDIQAITGATYSSQYVMDIVNDIIMRIKPQLDQHR